MITIVPRVLTRRLRPLVSTSRKVTHLVANKCFNIVKPTIDRYVVPATGLATIAVHQMHAKSDDDLLRMYAVLHKHARRDTAFAFNIRSQNGLAATQWPLSSIPSLNTLSDLFKGAQSKIASIPSDLLHSGIIASQYLAFAMLPIGCEVLLFIVERVAVPMILKSLDFIDTFLDWFPLDQECQPASDLKSMSNTLGVTEDIKFPNVTDNPNNTAPNSQEDGNTSNVSELTVVDASIEECSNTSSETIVSEEIINKVLPGAEVAVDIKNETLKLEDTDKSLGYTIDTTSVPKALQPTASISSFWSPPSPPKPLAIVAPKPRRQRGGRRNHKKVVPPTSSSENSSA